MKDRPILFSAPMVGALLAGAKTQTRRIVKPEHLRTSQPVEFVLGSLTAQRLIEATTYCPYGQPRDRLWVRETWCQLHDQTGKDIAFRADGWTECPADKWCPSIFMPRAASRITLEITAVRAERLQSISETDAQAEGVKAWQSDGHRMAYAELWNQINGPGSWAINPYVWVITFRRKLP